MPVRQNKELAEERRKRGPTRHPVSEELLFELAARGHSIKSIADYCGISEHTLRAHQDYLDIMREGRAEFQDSILSKQFKIAMDDANPNQSKMLIHIGKVQLGQKETSSQQIEINPEQIFEQLINGKKDG